MSGYMADIFEWRGTIEDMRRFTELRSELDWTIKRVLEDGFYKVLLIGVEHGT